MPDEPSQSFFLKLKNLFSLSKNSEEVLKINIGVTYVAAKYQLLTTTIDEAVRQTLGAIGQSLIPGEFSPGGII